MKPKNKYSIFADGQEVNSQSSFSSSSTATTSKSLPDSLEENFEDNDCDINASDDDQSEKDAVPDLSAE